MPAPRIELMVPEPVNHDDHDVLRLWDAQARAIRLGIPPRDRARGADGRKRAWKNRAELHAAVVRQRESGSGQS
jgi:hypothetical protein